MKNIFLNSILALSMMISFSSCDSDKLGDTIFEEVSDEIDPNSYTYSFDSWLKDNYLETYNIDFVYKMRDISTDMNYNLVPVTLNDGIDMAMLTKYLWLDAYKDVAGIEFMKEYGPRIIHLVGSPAYNPASGTMVLGLAEGGIKITLYRGNSLDYRDVEMMNEFYFKTMHHEFAHILHQTKTFPREFRELSAVNYDPLGWQDRDSLVAYSMGFVSNYGSSAVHEDFVEIIANYIVKDDATWNQMLDDASKGWIMPKGYTEYCCYYYVRNGEMYYVNQAQRKVIEDREEAQGVTSANKTVFFDVEDKDGVKGNELILQKLAMCRTWLNDSFDIDLDERRSNVMRRQENLNIEELRKELDQYKPETVFY